jgi:acyl-CoA reductase-like NAD-dependent aldehyde dehydrogenase
MKVYREEIFGPVACFVKYSDKDDVVALANDNNYGLAGSVWTKDIGKGVRTANALQAGIIWVNEHSGMGGLPTGGAKETGIGKDTFDAYCEMNSTYVNMSYSYDTITAAKYFKFH